MDGVQQRLETDLIARWGREEMTVYADYLQSIGDPRGEVIAIDLVNLHTVVESAWRARRHDALVAWLGADLAAKLGGMIFQGFVQEGNDESLLASPAGEFVRAFRIGGGDRGAIERLVKRPRPWLVHLAISGVVDTAIGDALVDKLVAATPRLDELVLRGSGIMDRFSHPTVRHVRLEGPVLGTLGWAGGWLTPPASFAIERVREPSETADSRLYVQPTAEWLNVLAEPAIQEHVTHLRYTGTDPALLVRVLGSLPRVAVIEVVAHGKNLDALRAAIGRKRPAVEIVALER